MLMNCPKCGFNQPKDVYCAKCGIEMAVYQPPQAPLWQKLLSNIPFQAAIGIALVAAAGTYFFKGNPFSETANTGPQARSAPRFATSASTGIPSDPSGPTPPSANIDPADTESESLSNSRIPAMEDELDAATESSAPGRVAGAQSGVEDPAQKLTEQGSATTRPLNGATGAEKSQIRISIYEMQTEYRNYLLNLATNPRDAGFPSGILENTSLATNSVGRSSSMIFNEQKDVSAEQNSLRTNYGYQVPNGPFLGLTIEVFLEKSDTKSATVSLGITRQWMVSLENGLVLDQPMMFGQTYELSKGNGIFVVGFFPSQTIPGEKALLSTNLSKVVGSTAFKNRLTDFVLLVELNNASN